MPEITNIYLSNSMDTSKLFRLNFQDLVKGLVLSVISAIVVYFSNPTLDLAMIDWGYMLKVSLTAGVSYLAKNFITDSEGKIGGIIRT